MTSQHEHKSQFGGARRFWAGYPESYREGYLSDQAENTLQKGRLFCLISIPAVSLFIAQDFLVLFAPEFLKFRIAAIISPLAFLILAYSPLKRNARLVLTAHSMNLLVCVGMMTGIAYVTFTHAQYSDLLEMGVISGMLAAFVAVFLFSAGARRFLPYILGVPLSLLFFVLWIFGDVSAIELSFFSNPAIAFIVIVVVGISREKLMRREYIMSRLAEKRKNDLSEQIEQITSLNKKLEKEIKEKAYFERRLEEQASTDVLTGLLNRRAGLEILDSLMQKAESRRTPLTVCFIDMDKLKAINDRFGHTEGDRAIRALADEFRVYVRKSDFVARLGGDEFLLIFPDCSLERARKIIGRMSESDFKYGFSSGFAEYEPEKMGEAADLVKAADTEMYMEKQRRNRE
ncbi:MAG: diguanylate cyclase [Spirochaetales bacterium]|jgi:diguanylate cyclase (GGDEF)-like protein|nr:diguanylate cyclase [Spirochaetales bacterium]